MMYTDLSTVIPMTLTRLVLILLTVGMALFLPARYLVAAHGSGRLRRRAEKREKPRLSFQLKRHPFEKKDVLPMVLITLIYAAVAFCNLGTAKNPETFVTLTPENYYATIELAEPTEISDIHYYTGLFSGGKFQLDYSPDGENWTALSTVFQRYSTLFKWYDMKEEMEDADSELVTGWELFPVQVKYLRVFLVEGDNLALGEFALYDADGNLIDASLVSGADENGALLVDEQDQIPDEISYLNSTYFDEVYHARTAYEHLNNVYPYEDSHPPLGKLIMSLGIMLLGMNTLGWRLMGTLLGVVMLPILYLFLKNLFGKTPLAACGTLLFAFDFMHFAQTRIATIDTYSVLFVLLSFFFLYRYFTVEEGAPLKKELLPLSLCGLSFGVGVSCKWTVLYAGLGLCVLYFWRVILKWRRHKKGDGFYPWLIGTLLWSVVFFILIPAVIYTLCYIPYAKASGNTVIHEMLQNQVFMFTYHNGVNESHPYSSHWWQWIIDARPILYYLEYYTDTKACIASFANPLICWSGLVAEVLLLINAIRRRCGTAIFLLIAWFAELFPWMLIGRTVFEYHYFGCILFLVFALVYVMDRLWELTEGRCKKTIYAFTGYSCGLFVLFYPVLSGLTVPRWYCNYLLKWFESWPFS